MNTDRSSNPSSGPRVSDIDLRELIRAYVTLGETKPNYELPPFYDEVVLALKELSNRRAFSSETEVNPVAWRYVVDSPYELRPRYAYSDTPRDGATPLYEGSPRETPAKLRDCQCHDTTEDGCLAEYMKPEVRCRRLAEKTEPNRALDYDSMTDQESSSSEFEKYD